MTAGGPVGLAEVAGARPVDSGDGPGRRTPGPHRWKPYVLLLPGLLWLGLFFAMPMVQLLATSLYDPSGSLETGYAMTLHWQNYPDALRDYAEQFGRFFLYAGIATVLSLVVAYPLAYTIAFKAGRWRNVPARAGDRAVLHELPGADARVGVDPLGQRAGGRHPARDWPARGAGSPARDTGRRGGRADVQLPAFHDAAALRQPRAAGLPPPRGRERPLRLGVDDVPHGDAAAVDAGRRRRDTPDVHPRRG